MASKDTRIRMPVVYAMTLLLKAARAVDETSERVKVFRAGRQGQGVHASIPATLNHHRLILATTREVEAAVSMLQEQEKSLALFFDTVKKNLTALHFPYAVYFRKMGQDQLMVDPIGLFSELRVQVFDVGPEKREAETLLLGAVVDAEPRGVSAMVFLHAPGTFDEETKAVIIDASLDRYIPVGRTDAQGTEDQGRDLSTDPDRPLSQEAPVVGTMGAAGTAEAEGHAQLPLP